MQINEFVNFGLDSTISVPYSVYPAGVGGRIQGSAPELENYSEISI